MPSDQFGDGVEDALEKTHSWLPEAMRPLADDSLESWWDVFWRFLEREHKHSRGISGPSEGQQRLVTDGGEIEHRQSWKVGKRVKCSWCGWGPERVTLRHPVAETGKCPNCSSVPEVVGDAA